MENTKRKDKHVYFLCTKSNMHTDDICVLALSNAVLRPMLEIIFLKICCGRLLVIVLTEIEKKKKGEEKATEENYEEKKMEWLIQRRKHCRALMMMQIGRILKRGLNPSNNQVKKSRITESSGDKTQVSSPSQDDYK